MSVNVEDTRAFDGSSASCAVPSQRATATNLRLGLGPSYDPHMNERRRSNRVNVDLFFNKFIDGHPYLCRTLDVSPSGVLAWTFTEPSSQAGTFPLELRLPGTKDSMWIWAKTVRWSGHLQAMKFEKLGRRDRLKLQAHFKETAALSEFANRGA